MRMMAAALAISVFLMAQSAAHAEGEGERSRFWAGAGVGALGENSETKTGLIGGAQLGWYWKYLGASFHALHYKADNKVNTMSQGTLAMTPLMVNLFGRIPLGRDADVRVGGGFSHIRVSHELSPEVQSFFSSRGFTVKEEVASGLGTQVLGGLNVFITQNIAVGADIIYLFFKPELTATVIRNSNGASASATADVKLDAVIGMANLRIYFN